MEQDRRLSGGLAAIPICKAVPCRCQTNTVMGKPHPHPLAATHL